MKRFGSKGFSIVETLVTVSVIGVIAGISAILVGDVTGSVRDQKLRSDVGTLNRAVKIYLANGGSLEGAERPEYVLERLRTKVGADAANRLPGLSSSMVDLRVVVKMQTDREASTDALRAYWDPAAKGFKVAQAGGRGIKAFHFDDDPGELSTATEMRDAPMLYASSDGWVWDYQDREIPARLGPTKVVTSTGTPRTGDPGIPPVVDPPQGVLQAPRFSVLGGAYPYSSFELDVELTNPNPEGMSDLYYAIEGGGFTLYSGPISVSPGTTVHAKAFSMNPLYVDSARVSQNYVADPLALLPPGIMTDREGFGLFADSKVEVTLTESNDPGISDIQYRTGGGEWILYTEPFTLAAGDYPGGVNIEAQSIPAGSDVSYYIASEIVARELGYENLALSGAADGGFNNPTGEANMVTNLLPGEASAHFKWGNTTGNGHSQSEMQFFGGAFPGQSVGERFKVGELTYYNGTIQSGSGAETVDLGLDLDLEVGGNTFDPSLSFTFELVNSPNTGNDPWQAADFVRISEPRSSETFVVNGYQFEFQLEFGETTEDGFSDFNEFHVLENSDARVNVYGTFINLGPMDGDGS